MMDHVHVIITLQDIVAICALGLLLIGGGIFYLYLKFFG